MGRILIVLVALITMGMGTAAHATDAAATSTTLVSGPIYGGTTQNTVFCQLFNGGGTSNI